MNNSLVNDLLHDVTQEISNLKTIINAQGVFHATTPYLTRYSLIKASGTLEIAFKSIIADFCVTGTFPQIDTFIHKKVRKNSMNPTYKNICTLLGQFDEQWQRDFKEHVKQDANKAQMLDALSSLSNARNEFAHGGAPNTSIDDIENYYINGIKVISILDNIVN